LASPLVLFKSKKCADLVPQTFQRLVHYLFISVSRYHHAIAYSILLLIVLIIPHGKKWELLEFNLAVLFLMILVNPLNKRIFE